MSLAPAGDRLCASDLLFAAYDMVAFADALGRPVACGGLGGPVRTKKEGKMIKLTCFPVSFQDSQQCYTYDDSDGASGAWSASLRTLQDREYRGSDVQLANGRAFVFGGFDQAT